MTGGGGPEVREETGCGCAAGGTGRVRGKQTGQGHLRGSVPSSWENRGAAESGPGVSGGGWGSGGAELQRNLLERTEGPGQTGLGSEPPPFELQGQPPVSSGSWCSQTLPCVSPEGQRSMSQQSALMLASSQDLNMQRGICIDENFIKETFFSFTPLVILGSEYQANLGLITR